MSGFFSSILTLLLGWIRALINNVWRLINSESGDAVGRLLRQHWLKLAVALCAIGVVADIVIYFFRWRPDYVWKSRLRRTRRAKPQPEPEPEPQPATVYEPVEPENADFLWEDAPAADWNDQPGAYGASQPEPISYYQDVQAGFARPIPPEAFYAPSPSYQASVHPGLDEEAFRQSFGLREEGEPAPEQPVPVMYAPAFRPFTAVTEEAEAPSPTMLSRLARRARSLVGSEEDDPRTIRDLQSTVNVAEAFHEPVYPQSNPPRP